MKNIKSDYFLQKLFNNINELRKLEIIKYNKDTLKRLKIIFNIYKEYSEKYSLIEIEIIPVKDKDGRFININQREEKFFHIFLIITKKKKLKEHI